MELRNCGYLDAFSSEFSPYPRAKPFDDAGPRGWWCGMTGDHLASRRDPEFKAEALEGEHTSTV
jgi:hypothetical protein